MILLNSWRQSFPKDVKFMINERNDKRQNNKCKTKGADCLTFHFREEKQNPGHLIDFKDFLEFVLARDPNKIDPHFRSKVIM